MNGVCHRLQTRAQSPPYGSNGYLSLTEDLVRPDDSRDTPSRQPLSCFIAPDSLPLLLRLAQIRRPVFELGELVQEHQFDLPHRAVALLGRSEEHTSEL